MTGDKILVVDDDPKVIQAVKMILKDYEIIEFQQGLKALDFLKQPNEVSLVLLDIYMQDVNGLEILDKLRKVNSEVAVIVMTAFGSKDVIIEALRSRADDFLEKPFDVTELRDKIRLILKEKSFYGGIAPSDRFGRMKRLIEKNCEKISLEHLAGEMSLSPKYISRMFRKLNDDSFRDYKLKLRISRAKTLLKSSAYPVHQIAEMLGYLNAESFMRIFKRMTGDTPTAYRKRFQE
jgi:YesN/AraC family two-component response regulator